MTQTADELYNLLKTLDEYEAKFREKDIAYRHATQQRTAAQNDIDRVKASIKRVLEERGLS